jgi:hypothetical protein
VPPARICAGLPMLSRYSRTRLVASSSSQYCNRSLADTSARLPAETKVETPRPRSRAVFSSDTPSAPDWAKNPIRPRRTSDGIKDALSWTCGSVFMIPSALGPMIRNPLARACWMSRCCSARPSAPDSPKPALTTTAPMTPARPQSAMASRTWSAGRAMTARSIGPGAEATDGKQATPSMTSASGWIATNCPVNCASLRLCSRTLPMVPSRRLAPISATPRGASRAAIERASPRCSRACMTSREDWVGPMSK